MVRRVVLHLATKRRTVIPRPTAARQLLTVHPAFDPGRVVKRKNYKLPPMLLGAYRVVKADLAAEVRGLWVEPVSDEYLSAYPPEARPKLRGQFRDWVVSEELHSWERPLKLGLPKKVGWGEKRDNAPFFFYDLQRQPLEVESITGSVIHATITQVGRKGDIKWFRILPEVAVRS